MKRSVIPLNSLSEELQQLLLLHEGLWGTDPTGQRYHALYAEGFGVVLLCLGRPLDEVGLQEAWGQALLEPEDDAFDVECARRSGAEALAEEPQGVRWSPIGAA